MKNELIALGSDPELFLKDEDGRNYPSEHFIKGDKYSPEDKGDGFFLLCDNVMVEFNTPPSYSLGEWIDNHKKALDMIRAELPEYIYLDIAASRTFEKQFLKSKLAKTFGCAPDMNCWTLDNNVSPSSRNLLRTAAGHIHISYTDATIPQSIKIAKLCDYFLGLPSLFLDKDVDRRKMYGKAGAIRLKSWGFEYRVLSNFWLASPEYTKWVYLQTKMIFEFLHDNPDFDFSDMDDVVDAINNYDLDKAQAVMNKYKDYFVTIKQELYV